jgi:hypothetical protein
MIFDCDKSRAGPLKGGMTRADVRKILGHFSEFKKSQLSTNSADDFEDVGAHVFYTEDNVIRGVEIFKGNLVTVRGIDIFSLPLPALVSELERIGIECVYDDVGARLLNIGVGIYSPDFGDVEAPSVEAVYVELH